MLNGKCPHCGSFTTTLSFDETKAVTQVGNAQRTIPIVSYKCSSCSVILSVQEDPILEHRALLADMKRELLKEIETIVKKQITAALAYTQNTRTGIR